MTPELIIGLVVAGLLLILAEVFIPGGFAGVLGGLFLAAGVVAGFFHGTMFGFWLLLASIVGGILAFWFWLKFFPRLPIGKRVILQGDAKGWEGYDESGKAFLGKEGVAKSPLHPAGIASIHGKRVDVITRGELIETGEKVKVIKVQGNRVVVSRVKEP